MVTINGAGEGTAASGKAMQGQGVGTANGFTTATYPSVASTSGFQIQSDGTNFISVAAPATSFMNGYVSTLGGSPLASTTYYLGQVNSLSSTLPSSNPIVQFYIPKAFTLTKVYGVIRVATTLGSAENCTVFIRVNDTSNTNITTTVKCNAVENPFNNTGLSISLNAGDFITFGFTAGAFISAPTNVFCSLAWSQ